MRVPRLDLTSPGARLRAAGVAGLLVCMVLLAAGLDGLSVTLGDTDDAMRLVLVRDLLGGRGWFDQLVTRLQPPAGVWMHWSRLLDGGLAAMIATLRLFTTPQRAETATRIAWPLLWVFPAVAATFMSAASLAGPGERGLRLRTPAALAAGALALVGAGQLMIQFRPGRIDHHDVQIVLALVALAGAMERGPSRRGAVACGLATGLGLAVGLEALLFEAALAAAMGALFLVDAAQAGRTRAYGLSLAAATALAFLAQTPPARWTIPACDALGWNLLLGTVTGGLLLALAAGATGGRAWPWRLAALSVAGGAALAVYLRLDPHCLRGPFADVDPRIRPFWLDHVNEVKSLKQLWRSDRADAVTVSVAGLMGATAWLALGLVPERRRDPAWPILGLVLALGMLAASSAIRMRSYMEWFAVVALAVAAAEAAMRLPRLRALGALGLGALFTPVLLAGLILLAVGATPFRLPLVLQAALGGLIALSLLALALRARRLGVRGTLGFAALIVPLAAVVGLLAVGDRLHQQAKPAKPEPPDTCFDARSYRSLALAPAGIVVSEIDLGPFVLAHTPSATMSAPYHRMSWGILKARGVLAASADANALDGAQARARALGVGYVLECPVHRRHADRDTLRPDSLQARLDRGRPPGWLAPITPAGAGLQVFRVAPLKRTLARLSMSLSKGMSREHDRVISGSDLVTGVVSATGRPGASLPPPDPSEAPAHPLPLER